MLPLLVFEARRSLVIFFLALATMLAATAAAFWLRLDPNVSALLPEQGQSTALRRYLKDFGGSDIGLVLLSAPAQTKSPNEALDQVAATVAQELRKQPSVQAASDRLSTTLSADPMGLWRYADKKTRSELAAALEPKAMRERLRVSRSLLVADPSGAMAKLIARDPLRLRQIVMDRSNHQASGIQPGAEGQLVSNDGRSRLVLVLPRGQALRSADAKAFVRDCEAVLAPLRQRYKGWTFALTGGHAIAAATENMLVRDLRNSTLLSLLLAAIVFGLSFRRLRAIVAVMPPLLLGSLWTVSLASLLENGLSAIAIAFMSVVIGVGVDTGVHVYAALLEARSDGLGPAAAATRARRQTWKPVLLAASAAAAAFASLSLSSISALRQLGWLCAAGELLTAVAIVIVTPWIGAWLEQGPLPKPRDNNRFMAWSWLCQTRQRAAAVIVVVLLPIVFLAMGYRPAIGKALVALRPTKLEPLQTQNAVYKSFGGRPGQWVVMLSGKKRDEVHQRYDKIVEALNRIGNSVDRVDSISQFLPSPESQRQRLAARDRLNLPQRADALAAALDERWEDAEGKPVGFAKERFNKVIASMRNPTKTIFRLDQTNEKNILFRRYIARSQTPARMALYVLVRPGHEARVEEQIRQTDPEAAVTGYGRLEENLRQSLNNELPRVGLLALLLVAATLVVSLRRARDVVLALLVIVTQGAMVLGLMRLFGVPLHIYNALVLPVLLGITVDEAMFLLFRARRSTSLRAVLLHEGPPIRTTALTTAAGFAGLLICDFDGLRHVGMVGALGSLSGLVMALLAVPAGLRLSGFDEQQEAETLSAGAN